MTVHLFIIVDFGECIPFWDCLHEMGAPINMKKINGSDRFNII
jgi:hypothetical protein